LHNLLATDRRGPAVEPCIDGVGSRVLAASFNPLSEFKERPMRLLGTAVSVTALAMTLFLATSDNADARERSRQGTWSKGNGASGTWNSQTRRERGHFKRDRQWTGPRGGGSSSVERNWDREAGTASANRSRTTARGTATSETAVQRTANGFSRDKAVTGPNGNTYGKSVDVTRDGNTWTRDVVVTGPNGGTRSGQQTVTVDPPN
jgi:hypothetical protein